MAKYSLNQASSNTAHYILLGPPLLAVILFCFGFVLMQPHQSTMIKSVTASQATSKPASQQTPLSLPVTGQQAQLTLQTDSTPQASANNQPADTQSSAASTINLQSAVPNHQSSGRFDGLPISQPSKKHGLLRPVSPLLNLNRDR